eukprot:scaffold37987_cov67-Cyclotella_meneghiniana.AAC.1
MEKASLLDIEDHDDSSSCSSTVLAPTKKSSVVHFDDDISQCTLPTMFMNSAATTNNATSESNYADGEDEELTKLRCTASLMDDSFDSEADEELEENKCMIMTPPIAADSTLNSQDVKTVKKSNKSNSTAADQVKEINRSSIFRKPTQVETPKLKLSVGPLHKAVATPLPAPYDETIHNSFDNSMENSLMDTTYESFDELDKEAIKRRRRSNKFLSVYDDISAQAISKSSTIEKDPSKGGIGKVKRMSDAFSTAMQSVAGGSWSIDDKNSLSGKKRPLSEISGLQNLRKTWGSHNYAQMQLMEEQEEERMRSIQHENLTAYESVTIARTESMVAAESKKEVELERDLLKQQVSESKKECNVMKEAMIALAEAEKCRVKTIHKLEKKLQKAKSLRDEATASAMVADKEAASLRNRIEILEAENRSIKAKNESISAELKDKKEWIERECINHKDKLMTAKKEAKKWQLQVEENSVEIQMLQMKLTTAKKSSNQKSDHCSARRTPAPDGEANWSLINAFGAEDITSGSELFNQQTCAEKQPLETVLLSPPGQSSRQLSYVQTPVDKENQPNNSSPLLIQKIRSTKQQSKCCLCFKEAGGVMKTCQCGQKSCNKRAHAACLAKYKVGSISTCVSHPGTPLPPMPLILCAGLWKK